MLTVYLDQKDWIGLAKAIYRQDATDDQRAVARRLRQFADGALVRFPVSETHLMEAARIGKREQRLQLASVFSDFSQGWYLASRQARMGCEIETALARAFGIESPHPTFDAFAKDFFWAFGDYPFLSQLFSMPVDTLKIISAAMGPGAQMCDYLGFDDDENRRTAVERLTKGVQELVSRIEMRRARTRSESVDMRSRIYSALLFMEIQPKLDVALQTIGRTFDDLRALPDDRVAAIIDSIPCLDVERCLALRAEREASTEGNDVFDIAALSAAIPYCDIVVTEKSWAHLARVSGIASKYGTDMLPSLEKLDGELQRAFTVCRPERDHDEAQFDVLPTDH